MISFEEITNNIESNWITAPSLDVYLSLCYKLIFDFCASRYDLDETELKVHKRYKYKGSDIMSKEIFNYDLKYVFILLCALKNPQILELVNFTVLPTDIKSFTEHSILREIEITKSLIKN